MCLNLLSEETKKIDIDYTNDSKTKIHKKDQKSLNRNIIILPRTTGHCYLILSNYFGKSDDTT